MVIDRDSQMIAHDRECPGPQVLFGASQLQGALKLLPGRFEARRRAAPVEYLPAERGVVRDQEFRPGDEVPQARPDLRIGKITARKLAI